MNAIILAGGRSSRMGFNKAFIEFKGMPLIRGQIKLLKKIFKKIIIVTNSPEDYKLRGVKITRDIISGRGPLSGIHAGLTASDSAYNFVIACDMPFINSALIKYMVSIKDNFDAVVPRLRSGYEALFSIYSKDCLPQISKILKTSNLKVANLFTKIKLREVREDELSRFGAPDSLFMNVNTKQDLAKIKKMRLSL